MQKLTILTLSVSLTSLMLGGCAMLRKGPSDEELVMQQVRALVDDLLAGNVDKLLGYVSEDFSHPNVASKESLAGYIETGKQMGYLDNVPALIEEHQGKVNLDQAKVTVEGGNASVYPIEASSNEGSVTVELKYKKDPDGVWRVVGAVVEGV